METKHPGLTSLAKYDSKVETTSAGPIADIGSMVVVAYMARHGRTAAGVMEESGSAYVLVVALVSVPGAGSQLRSGKLVMARELPLVQEPAQALQDLMSRAVRICLAPRHLEKWPCQH